MDKIFFIADTHFGHANCIKFDDRPFDSIEQMDAEMIWRWNWKIRKGDHVYVLGDFAYRNKTHISEYTRQLNGHIHLIRGNHDKRSDPYESCFESVSDYKDLPVAVNDTCYRVILCHYFIPFYNGARRGAYMLHGHTHRSAESDLEEQIKNAIRQTGKRCEAFNVGCMWQDYAPQTLEEILEERKKE